MSSGNDYFSRSVEHAKEVAKAESLAEIDLATTLVRMLGHKNPIHAAQCTVAAMVDRM